MTEQQIINLTPHPVTLFLSAGELTLASEGSIRLAERRSQDPHHIDMPLPVYRVDFGSPILVRPDGTEEPLPPERPGVLYIVSRMVVDAFASPPDHANAPSGRIDLVAPYDLVRDEVGRVIGARALAR